MIRLVEIHTLVKPSLVFMKPEEVCFMSDEKELHESQFLYFEKLGGIPNVIIIK